MKSLTARSEAGQQIIRALNLPKGAVAFTLRMSAFGAAKLDVESYAEQGCAETLATVLKHYRLEAIEGPNVPVSGHQQPRRDEETAAQMARILMEQVERDSHQCAFWFISALSKLTSTHPQMQLSDVLQFAQQAMPKAASDYRLNRADKC
jgi:hypothetical protein